MEIAKYGKASPAPQAAVTIQQTPTIAATPDSAATAPVVKLTPLPAPAATPAAARPRITIMCLEPGEKGGEVLALPWAAQHACRFAQMRTWGRARPFASSPRRRAREIALAQMHQGDLYRSKLPPELCAGVASSKVEIQILGGKQVVDTLGPYNLRC